MQEQVPEFLQDMFLQQYGKEITDKIIGGYNQKRYVTLRINTLKTTQQKIYQELSKEKISFKEVSWYKEALIIKVAREEDIRKLSMYENGEIYLQSLSSMIPPIILEPKAKENILDMAAAPGGKTTQIATLTHNEAMITACEKNKIRVEKLKYNIQKQGAKYINIMTDDARNLSDFLKFDKILLDSPCSGSGTDNVKQKYFTKELINKSVKIQEELLKKALKLLRPGNEMIYSTCSILKQENEEILKKVKDKIEILPIDNLKDIPLLPVTIKGTVCICPTNEYEGFFVAKIKKL